MSLLPHRTKIYLVSLDKAEENTNFQFIYSRSYILFSRTKHISVENYSQLSVMKLRTGSNFEKYRQLLEAKKFSKTNC